MVSDGAVWTLLFASDDLPLMEKLRMPLAPSCFAWKLFSTDSSLGLAREQRRVAMKKTRMIFWRQEGESPVRHHNGGPVAADLGQGGLDVPLRLGVQGGRGLQRRGQC